MWVTRALWAGGSAAHVRASGVEDALDVLHSRVVRHVVDPP